MTDQKKIKEILKPVINQVNTYPMGIKVPSDWEVVEGYRLEKLDVYGVSVEHLVPPNSNGKVILQFHGGGFRWALLDPYRDTALAYSQMAGNAEVYSVDYRIAPQYRFPSANEDCIKVYQYLLESYISNEDIILVGDSAGGNLVLSVTLQLKDEGIELPKAVIAISPWTDVNSNTKSIKSNYEKDLVLGKYGMRLGKAIFDSSYLVDFNQYKMPYVSPLYGKYEGFPDVLVQTGTYEMLYDEILDAVSNMKEAGVNCQLSEYEGMSHDFQLLVPGIEETKQAWAEMQAFVAKEFRL